MAIPQYTTPTFTLTFDDENLDLTEAENVYVTFRSGGARITKSGEDLTVNEKTIDVFLTQSDTGKFSDSEGVDIQANWTMAGEGRAASEVAHYEISEQLLNEVIE